MQATSVITYSVKSNGAEDSNPETFQLRTSCSAHWATTGLDRRRLIRFTTCFSNFSIQVLKEVNKFKPIYSVRIQEVNGQWTQSKKRSKLEITYRDLELYARVLAAACFFLWMKFFAGVRFFFFFLTRCCFGRARPNCWARPAVPWVAADSSSRNSTRAPRFPWAFYSSSPWNKNIFFFF